MYHFQKNKPKYFQLTLFLLQKKPVSHKTCTIEEGWYNPIWLHINALKYGSNFSFFKTVLIFFQITSKNEGLSDVNHVYTSAYTSKSIPLLESDFCIQIMESYLHKEVGMVKRSQIQIHTLKKQKQMSSDSSVYILGMS